MVEERIIDLLRSMDEKNASDLFLTAGASPYFRVFGKMELSGEPPISEDEMSHFYTNHLPAGFAERFVTERDIDLGISLNETERYRLNMLYQRGCQSMVARRVPMGHLDVGELGLPDPVRDFANLQRGLVLITGAACTGKSSTMAALLNHMNQTSKRHIITIEDPIEFLHQSQQCLITQREVGSDTSDFQMALKQAVRQSPDVIFIGELRDLNTVATAISAAMTGHLVVSTMHTVNPEQTLERIVNYYPEHLRDQVALDLSLCLAGIVSQRLLQRKDGGGLVPAVELLKGSPVIAQAVVDRDYGFIPELIKVGAPDGMISFSSSLAQLVRQDLVSLQAASAAATDKAELLLIMEGMETGIDSLRNRSVGEDNSTLSMKSLLKAAIRLSASDLLLTAGSSPMVRVDGELLELDHPPLSADLSRRLVMSVLSPSQRVRFDTDHEIDFALSVNRLFDDGSAPEELAGHRFRVNGFFQKGTVAGAFRTIRGDIPCAKALNLPDHVMSLADRPTGLVLVTGPTGHGKSTTLACMVDHINKTRRCHIITVEDPIEFVHKSKKAVIEQREVLADTESFATALKYVLRQDPDVILVGEMRDVETISAALTAAETGHLVLATLHTNDCAQTIDRIIDSFPPHQQNQVRIQLANALTAVLSQRLLPRADNNGRIAAFEVMVASTAIRSLIRDKRNHLIASTLETSANVGMMTMARSREVLYQQGLISAETMKFFGD